MGKPSKRQEWLIVKKYLEGKTIREISKEYITSYSTIWRILKYKKINTKVKRHSKLIKNYIELCEKYISGKSLKELAKEYNTSIWTIRNELVNNNIKIKPNVRKLIPRDAKTIKCGMCKEIKTIENFHNHKGKILGKKNTCKNCINEYTKYYRFGITKEQYRKLISDQQGLCAICHKPESSKSSSGQIKTLSIDHIHGTNIIRGLLCAKCNSGIAFFEENIAVLEDAMNYLKERKEKCLGKRILEKK